MDPPFKDIKKLSNDQQVSLRLWKILDSTWKPPKGHRVFLRELLQRLQLFADGEIEEHELWAGGWSMGQDS